MEPSSRCSIPSSAGMDVLLMRNKPPGEMEQLPRTQTPMAVNVGPLLVASEQPRQIELLPDIAMTSSMELQQPSTVSSFIQAEAASKLQNSLPTARPQQLSLKNKQSFHVEQSQRTHSYSSFKLALQPSMSANESSMQREPLSKIQMVGSVNKGMKHLPSVSKVARMDPLQKVPGAASPTLGTPQLSSKNKRKPQTEKLSKVQSVSLTTQVASPANRKVTTAEPSPKVHSESFESVRSKLRESLAAALALVSEAQKSSQASETTASTGERNTRREMVDGSDAGTTASSASSQAVTETSSEFMNSRGDECGIPLKPDEKKCLPSDTFTNGDAADYEQLWKCHMQEFDLKHASFGGGMPFSNNLMFKDDLLQGNGLCWASDNDFEMPALKGNDTKRLKLTPGEASSDSKEESVDKTQHLATKIEAELFRLFGGVNKKYKEKGRSLLFNLKDPNNPELRERVYSEEITPERLCSMTAEELASKQLTEWRIAKAEEFAQMVVLPESDIDLRRLVKKTHKGEFQVEVEKDDTIPVEVAVGANSLPHAPTRANEAKNPLKITNHETQTSTIHGEIGIPDNSVTSKKLDLGSLKPQDMQDLMIEELKDTEFLPAIVSLDEFMEALDSEPPFQSLPVDVVQDSPSKKKEADGPEFRSNSTPDGSYVKNSAPKNTLSKPDVTLNSLTSKPDTSSDSLATEQDHLPTASADLQHFGSNHPDEIDSRNISTKNNNTMISSVTSELDNSSSDISANDDSVWEGLVQLNISSLVTVSGFFKSGEKTSTKEWPGFLEIKGRVRVDAFEKFLQELPSSRSRAIMVVHFQWKEGSPESGRASLLEAADTYVADERVGYAEPAPGVELYFCPPHARTIEMLEKHIPREQLEALASADGGLVGVVVWRRPHATSVVSPRPSNHKHTNSRKHSVSRKQHPPNPNTDAAKRPTTLLPLTPVNAAPPLVLEPQSDEAGDDVPPGFGPRATKEEDDLPEFDFRGGSRLPVSNPHHGFGEEGVNTAHGRPVARRPAAQMRELIQKYGQGDTASGAGTAPLPSLSRMQPHMEPWDDDDDDDIPEWRPHQDSSGAPLQGFNQLPPALHQESNPRLMSAAGRKPLLTVHRASPSQLVPPAGLAMHPPVGANQVPWRQGAWWPNGRLPMDAGFSPNGPPHPCHYGGELAESRRHNNAMMGGYGSLQNSRNWRSDVDRGRGI